MRPRQVIAAIIVALLVGGCAAREAAPMSELGSKATKRPPASSTMEEPTSNGSIEILNCGASGISGGDEPYAIDYSADDPEGVLRQFLENVQASITSDEFTRVDEPPRAVRFEYRSGGELQARVHVLSNLSGRWGEGATEICSFLLG